MRLTAFQSGKGDCLLLTNDAGSKRILIDGGMPADYTAHVAAAMGKLGTAKKDLDVVYISHIDRDHIGGVLRMLDDEAAWRIHLFQKQNGNTASKPPKVARPPKVKEIWHNAFHAQFEKNAGPIEDALAAMAPILAGSTDPEILKEALKQSDLVSSVGDAIEVSRRIGAKQLNIPLNPRSNGKLMMARTNQAPIKIGDLTITILGPHKKFLDRLRTEWNDWLKDPKNAPTLKRIMDAHSRDEARLGTSEFDGLVSAFQLEVESFGNPKQVTAPNLASLTLLVKDANTTLLLTGDAEGGEIVDDLKTAGLLAPGGTFTVDVLKVQHHAAENNVDSTFVETVLARDYVFCGNGEHGNPDLKVVEMMARRRHAASAKPFKFWFNSSKGVSAESAHMGKLEQICKKAKQKSSGKFSFQFLNQGSTITIL